MIIIALGLILSLYACKKDSEPTLDYSSDKTLPTMEITVPVDSSEYLTATNIYLSGIFNDDIKLQKCVASIKKVGDLKSLDIAWLPKADTIYFDSKSRELSNYQIFNRIPADASYGYYKLSLQLFDMNNNLTIKDIIISIPF